jgi:hypothetical protein
VTDADLLREAVALIRQRAEAATSSPWRDSTVDGNRYAALVSDTMPTGRKPGSGWDDTEGYGGYLIAESLQPQDRQYIASWHPAVAIAASAWLEASIPASPRDRVSPEALAVARTYLRTGEVV